LKGKFGGRSGYEWELTSFPGRSFLEILVEITSWSSVLFRCAYKPASDQDHQKEFGGIEKGLAVKVAGGLSVGEGGLL
jgi:hypothetical protein